MTMVMGCVLSSGPLPIGQRVGILVTNHIPLQCPPGQLGNLVCSRWCRGRGPREKQNARAPATLTPPACMVLAHREQQQRSLLADIRRNMSYSGYLFVRTPALVNGTGLPEPSTLSANLIYLPAYHNCGSPCTWFFHIVGNSQSTDWLGS